MTAPPTIPSELAGRVRYDGHQAVPGGPGWYRFTTIAGASAGASWTVRPGGDVAEKYREVEERFSLPDPPPCPRCAHPAPVRAWKYAGVWWWSHDGGGCGASWPVVEGQEGEPRTGGRFEPTRTAYGNRTGD